jgi:hypothetical protein
VTKNRLLVVRRALFAAAASLAIALACSPHYTFVPNNQIEHCVNGVADPSLGETDVDCGGSDCHGCALGKNCTVQSDCSAGQCLGGSCQMPGCTNGVQDGDETGIDCGGECKGCHDGDSCTTGTDCQSNVCNPDGHCASPSCDDKVRNGDEVARDCGGAVCDPCPAGSPCLQNSDCQSNDCDDTTKTCVLVCAKNTDDCDSNGTDCETNLLTSVDNCGVCGHACDLPNANPSCVGGECQIDSCVEPFAHCTTDDSAGCETDLGNDVMNCGACSMECPAVNGTASCSKGKCVISCDDNFGDCDNDPSNGCETSLSDVNNCGECGKTCDNVDGKQAFCRDGKCGATACADGLGDCNGDGKCEFDINNDPDNCGRCGNVCSVVHGTPGCKDGQCVVASCDGGFDNCNDSATDGGYSDGCEANLNESADNCGACGHRCNVDNGSGTCDQGSCAVVSCDPGFKNCDENAPDHGANNGCETDTTSDAGNCGGCGNACMATNAVSACVKSECTIASCTGHFDDCTPADGCETDTSSSIQHCGSCTGTCSKAGATSASCTDGACDPPVCDASHLDCDGNHANGCETDLTLPANCGECGNACPASAPSCLSIGGTYRCQSTITYLNDVEASAQGTTLNLSHTLKAGTNRLVLAAIVMESTQSSGLNGARPTAVTYGGVAMNAGGSQTSDAGTVAYENPYLYYYYLTESGPLPANGGQTLHVTGATNKVGLIAANVIEFGGVDPDAPLVNGTGKIVTNAGATCVTTSAVTTVLPGTALYTLSAAHYSGTATVTGQQLLTPPAWDSGQIYDQMRTYATYGGTDASPLAAGTYTVGFTYQWCNPAVNLPVGVVPYRQP